MKKSMTRSESVRKMESEQQKQQNQKARVAIIVLMYFTAFAIVYFTYHHYSSIKSNLMFAQAKIKKLESQLTLITELGFYFSIFVFGNWVGLFLLTTFTNRREDDPIVHAFRRNISNSLEHFLIFMGIYAYSLISHNGLGGYKKKQYTLLANWFIISRILYGILSIIDSKFKYSFRELGSTLSVLTIAVMLVNLSGYNLLAHI